MFGIDYAAAIGTAGSLLAGGLSYLGQRKANKENITAADRDWETENQQYQ